jgi:transmembrane sensor
MIREVLTLEQLEGLGSDEAAALLLVRQDAFGDDCDEAVFEEWLAADPAHAEAWVRACNAWSAFDGADDADLRKLRETPERSVDRQARPRRGFAIAASIAVIAATGGAVLFNWQGGTKPGGTVSTEVASGDPERLMLTTAKGEHRSFQLADTSTVTLNTDSAVAVAFRPGERRLDLIRGQAFFKVAQDKARPFVVAADGQTVTALGTQFEVRTETSSLRVVLVEGRVSVTPARGTPVVMRAGQQLLAGPQGITMSAADVDAVNDWQRGIVTFKGATLASAVSELNRYSRAQLKVEDPRLAELTVSGVFQTNDVRRFARTIAEIYQVKVVPAGGETLRIVPAGSGTLEPSLSVDRPAPR